jgi:fumarylacetoacetate (FAA) hydrolase
MKLVSFLYRQQEHLGFIRDEQAFPLQLLDERLPGTMDPFLLQWETLMPLAREAEKKIMNDLPLRRIGIPVADLQLLAPVPRPGSFRDGYAFRQHVETARRNRRLPMVPEFDRFPIFYFTNHRSVRGPGTVPCMPDHFQQLDFELEVAALIVKQGRNIRAKDAGAYIGGLMIMNDLSARHLQMEEMKLNLGPAKGKDFATCIGPWLVTQDELEVFETDCATGHTGTSWKLKMSCSVNGKQLSQGNLADMQWTFAEIIERAAYGADLYPGDLIGSGTVGTGCLLELNGTAALRDPAFIPQWLKAGDTVKMDVEGLGSLNNRIVSDPDDFSLLKSDTGNR